MGLRDSGVGGSRRPAILRPDLGGLDDEVADGVFGFDVVEAFEFGGEALFDLGVGFGGGGMGAEVVAEEEGVTLVGFVGLADVDVGGAGVGVPELFLRADA